MTAAQPMLAVGNEKVFNLLGLPLCSVQEARKRHPVPDRERVHPRHACRGGSLPSAEEGLEQADDRGVPGQSTETVQQGCPGVSMSPAFRIPPKHGTKHTKSRMTDAARLEN